jgi:hypothetical protein
MSRIILGKSGVRNAGFDIDELLVTRLLITANSGGGKSYLVRCYRRLPAALRQSLWKRFGEGFEQAYHGCLSWFRVNDSEVAS